MVSSIFTTGYNAYSTAKKITKYTNSSDSKYSSIFTELSSIDKKKLNELIDKQIDSLNPFSSAGNVVANAIFPGGSIIDKIFGGVVSKTVNKFLEETGLSKYTDKFFDGIKSATRSITSALFGGNGAQKTASRGSSNSSGSSSGSFSNAVSNVCSKIGDAVKSFANKVKTSFSESKTA